MLRGPVERAPSGRPVAVTAIEHGNIVITVASLMRKSGPSPSAGTDGTFVTTILGGPLGGETREGATWSTMIRIHAGAVTQVAEFVASEPECEA
jgi:hypothetical protein